MTRSLIVLAAIFLISCSGENSQPGDGDTGLAGSNAEQTAQSAVPIDPDRKARLEANLAHQLRHQLQGQTVTVTALGPSDFADLDSGRFVIGQQAFSFLTSHDDTRFYVLATEPFNAGLSQADIADELAAEQIANDRQVRERASVLKEATVDLPYRGTDGAPVLIVEFSDFQCPYCKMASETVEQVLENHPSDVKFVYAHFPLDMHPWAGPSAIAAVCAAQQDQDAHWTLHDYFFQNQDDISTENVLVRARQVLEGTDIDLQLWQGCAEDTTSEAHQTARAAVNASFQLGRQMGVSGTPGFFINGIFVNGALPVEQFESLIATAKAEAD